MAVPRLPDFNAAAWRDRLKEAIPKRPDGVTITVWDQLPGLVSALRGQRDVVARHDVQLADHKVDIDWLRSTTDARLDDLELKVAALEAQPSVPFPGSG